MNPETPESPVVAPVTPNEQLPVAQPATVTPPLPPEPEKPHSKDNKKKNTFLILGAVIILLIVAAVGIFAFTQSLKPAEQVVEEPSPTPEAMEVKDETADWKTFANVEYGYIIKYPSTEFGVDSEHWTVSEDIETPGLKSEPYVSLACCGLSLDATVNIFVEEVVTPREFLPSDSYPNINVTEIQFNSFNASEVLIAGATAPQKWIFINRNNKTYILNTWGTSDDEVVRAQILSTFEFVDSSQIPARGTGFTVPDLPSDLVWNEVPSTEQKLSNPGLLYHKNDNYGGVALTGREWISESTFSLL
jgi:hypothetical protein